MLQPLPPLILANVVLWSIAAALFYLFAFLFLRQSIKYREEPRVKILAFIGMFLILVGLSRTLHPIIYTFSINDLYLSISQVFFLAAIIMVVIYVEREIYPASHYAMTIILSVGEVLYIINSDLFSLVIAFAMGAACLFIIILYLRLAIKSSEQLRRKAIHIIIGILLFAGIFVASVLEEIGLSLEQTGLISVIFAYASLPFLLRGFQLTL